MHARLAILLAAAACAAGAEDFTLDGGIVATTAPDGGVTFRAGGATLAFAPFECAPSESGAKPVFTFRADGDALVAEVAGDPAAFGRVSFGRCSAMPKELYFGYGYCVRDPGRLHVPLNGHHNATRFAGFTFANGLSLVLATTTAPDALFVDPQKGAFGFACSQPTRFTFVPGRAGAFDCALRARRHFAEKAPRGFAAKAGRFCVDTWNGAFTQHERLIRRCAEYGLRDDLLFYVHCWQRYGFDRHLPDVYPPSPTFGTAAELKRACATAHARGWSFGVHLNVIDCYTNSPWFDWSKIGHDAKGRPIKAWINPPYQEQSYRLLPEFAPASISYQVESLLADGFCPDTVFVDVTGSGAMSSGTCRDATGRVHPLILNTAANGRMFDTARSLLEGAGKRPAFVSSEAPCDYLAGHMDGGDCQWMFLSHESDVYRWMTVGGTGLVTKVPWMPLVWHDRLSLHGAGYSARFEGARGEDCHGIDSDDYISCEIMNGHSLMADCYNRDAYKAEAGILDAIDEPRCLRQIVRKYWLAQHVIREIGAASVQGVFFPDGDPRHVKVVWSTGMTVFVNRDVRDWTVATGDARVGEVTLPQYGFVAFNSKTGNFASIRRRGRRVVEESVYRDGAKLVRYVNPRGADTARNRLPLASATTVCRSGDNLIATVNWRPFNGVPVPKGTFRVSLWLLDPMFREYSPKAAASRVATADVTLDQPTRFSFAWPKSVKGPRVVHVAVAPAGADADNPDLRFKLLGTSAFYRRYRQGSLSSDGTWTPYRCPDENLWERLFPPSEPVDYGWISTDEAFRLITEPGKPDVKNPLPAGVADEAVAQPETVRLWDEGCSTREGRACRDRNEVPCAADLKQPAGIEFSVITKNEPQVDGYNWLHGVALCWHKGRLYASYGRNRGQENTPTEEMHVRASDDGGKTWGPVQVVATGGAGCGVSHGSFASHDGVLWCFAGTFSNKCSFVHTRAFTLDETSGKWVPRGVVAGEGFWPMQSPQRLPDGNWIMGGLRVANGWNLPGGARPAAAISHGDDFTKWDVSVVGKGEVARCWGEATVDAWGPCVTLTMRPGWNARPSVAYVATSADGGRAWTALKPTNLPLATSKPFTGVLSTGQRYVISQTTADGGTRRFPLTIAVSRPGEWAYSRVYLIRHAVFPEGPGASHPKAALAYPYAVEHAGKLYVGYSNSNGGGNFRNSAELAVIPVISLK